jgi:hypothetical protein
MCKIIALEVTHHPSIAFNETAKLLVLLMGSQDLRHRGVS